MCTFVTSTMYNEKMNYVSIINTIFFIISILVAIYIFHYYFFAIAGLFHRKTFPKAEEQCRYGIIVSAKDEENVIPRLIKSIRNADYPQDKLVIYIIAHNCKDKTADVAREMGVNVIVYNNENARTLGSAYQYAFKQINIDGYDAFIVLNADNVVSKNYFEKINDAFIYHNKHDVITTFRHALNIKDGVLPAIYSYYFSTVCLLNYIGRECFNVACRVTGCGFAVPVRLLQEGWNYTSITEDIEFSNDKVLNGEIIRYADEAIFYDEQPRDFKTMWFQRLRWAKGQNYCSRKYFPKLLKGLFTKNNKNKTSIYVYLIFNSFIPLLFLFLFLIQNTLLLFSPLFGVSLQDAFLYWNPDLNWFENLFLSFNLGAVFGMMKSFGLVLLGGYITATLILLESRGKYKGQPVLPMIGGFLAYPFFLLLQIPLDFVSLFIREVKWRKIPHGESKKTKKDSLK